MSKLILRQSLSKRINTPPLTTTNSRTLGKFREASQNLVINFTAMGPLASILLSLPFWSLGTSQPNIKLVTTVRPRETQNLLFGPVTLPKGSSIQQLNLTLLNFNDEVFDVSSISVFGTINDGECVEGEEGEEEEESGKPVVLGPADTTASLLDIGSAALTVIDFNDEVFDISSISVFGDINDGVCAPPADESEESAD
jgi:hypothetical protein